MNDPRDARRLGVLVLGGVLIVTFTALVANAVNDSGGDTLSPAETLAPTETEPDADPAVDPAADPDDPAIDPVDTSPPSAAPRPSDNPLPPTSQISSVQLRLERAVEIPLMTGMIWNSRESAYYATTQDGFVHRIPEDLATSQVVLDGTDFITDFINMSERGLIGIEFDPRDGRMVLHYTDKASNSHVSSFAMVDGRPDVASKRQILYLEQPGPGHQGGGMHFEPDGTLFVAFGDGGGSRGRDAQDYTKLLGAIVRILPNPDGDGYTVPPDNPFVNNPNNRPEIWAKGLRNPFSFSINPATGDMWIGDVGEDTRESLNFIPAGTSGQNFGWYWYEGSLLRNQGDPPPGLTLTPPLYDYGRDQGVSIIAGHVYHGTAIPGLSGAFIFADMSGPLYAYGSDGVTRLTAQAGGVVTGIVETPERELLVISLQRGVSRLLPA